MQKKQRLMTRVAAIILAVCAVFAMSTAVFADTTPAPTDEADCATFLKAFCPGGDKDIVDLIMLVADIMTAGIIVAGTIGIIICGYTVLTARDNTSQVEKAKSRLFEIVIGLVAWVLGAALIHFLLPKADQADEIMGIIKMVMGGII